MHEKDNHSLEKVLNLIDFKSPVLRHCVNFNSRTNMAFADLR